MSSPAAAVTPTVSWLTHLRRETERFADVVRQSPLRAHVPAYPDFTVHRLAAHIGRGLRLFHAIAAGGEQPALEVPEGTDVADWVLAGLAPLVTVLG
jgi:Mycothiol maleylpyruvate isomerase N-terminal domain